MKVRIGSGYDIHRLVPGRKLILGGVAIEHSKGLLGHSDADVLMHAICDAVLGAIGLPDIGQIFPDSSDSTRGIDSGKILKYAADAAAERGFTIGNVDAVIIAEEPELSPHLANMRRAIARILRVNECDIGVKVKSNEGLDSIGRGEAIAAFATAIATPPRRAAAKVLRR
ncbi:MAG: 2-C-methyl-D-erythritol 2,4-cyclodiphosphate synthase [Puniceicoccales bacterium]|nr:2-C-methyl-D-erythritol 2,4-cyclodiphosphate synthase [Puniceicoccales bacterium]